MTVWWYFKDNKYSTIADQSSAARSVRYDTDNVESRWFGAHPLASHYNCKEITGLFYDAGAEARGISVSRRPVKKGDTLWVYDVFCLGSTNDKILTNLIACHNAGIHLRIYTIQYHDVVRDDGSNDYILLSEVMKQLRKRHSPKKRKKAGHPSRNISYLTLSDRGKQVIQRYYKKDGTYTLETAIKAMYGTPRDGGSVGRDTFYRLLHEYEKIMKSKKDKE